MLEIMKKILVLFTLTGLFGCFENKAQNTKVSTAPTYGYKELTPTRTQEQVEQFATQFMS